MKKKLIFWLVALLLVVGFGQADWYYNPATGQIDYYEPVSGANFGDLANVTLTGVVNGNVLYYNGIRWVNLAVGAAGEVLTVAAGRPAWAAAAGGAPVGASYMTLGLNGVLTAERVLTAGAGIGFADTGANGTLTISSIPDLANIFYVSATGGDYATITSALAAENAGGEVFLIGPGTYANDQIDFSANNQTVIGMGDTDDVHVTQADTTVIPFGAFTDCVVMNVHVEVTAPTTAAADVITGTGGLTLFDVHVELSNTNVVVADQPACLDTTGIVLMNRGWIEYANTGNDGDGTTAIKAAVRIGAGAVVWFDHTVFTVSGGNQSLALTSSYATAGLISFYRCNVDVNDDASSNTIGITYSNMAAGTHEMFGNDIHVDNSANIAHGVFLINADTIRSTYNHIHVTGATAYGLNAEAGTTIISQFDDIIATTPTQGAGTITYVHSHSDGNFRASGTLYGATYGSDGSITDAEFLYINTLGSNAQTQINGKAATGHNMATHGDDDTYNISTSGTAGTGEITVADGGGINLQEDITYIGATGVNLIKFPDNLAEALVLEEAGTSYQTFVSTNTNEEIQMNVDSQFDTVYYNDAETTASPSGAFTVDWNNSNCQRVTITGVALDITFTNPPGPTRLILVVVQGDGDDTIDWTNEADILFPGGVDPTLSTGNTDVDIVAFYFDGTNYFGLFNGNFE